MSAERPLGDVRVKENLTPYKENVRAGIVRGQRLNVNVLDDQHQFKRLDPNLPLHFRESKVKQSHESFPSSQFRFKGSLVIPETTKPPFAGKRFGRDHLLFDSAGLSIGSKFFEIGKFRNQDLNNAENVIFKETLVSSSTGDSKGDGDTMK